MIKIDISATNRRDISKILNTLLADEYVLYTKTRNYHWNVVGIHFHDFHKFFEAQYEELDEMIDEIAERVRALGEKTVATLKEFSELSRLKEQPGRFPSDKDMIANLLNDHETIIRQLRKDQETCGEELGDAGTSDFLTSQMEAHEKMAWMLRSLLEK